MGYAMVIDQSVSAAGKRFRKSVTVEGNYILGGDVSIPAAKTGTLTTRTDNDTGTITGQSGHGVTTGARLDVYWSGGSRRGLLVGTVSGTSIPIDGGTGDNLPAATTPVTLMVPTEEDLVVTGNDVKALAVSAGAPANVVFATSGNAEIKGYQIEVADGGDAWADEASDAANPLAGGAVAKMFLSHGDATAAKTISVVLLKD